MAEYKVVFEIQVSAESPLEAAKIVQSWLKERNSRWEYVVQKDGDNPIYLVDLEEEKEDDIVSQVNYYQPLIQ